ncbi:hypothetical protein P8833_16350 [Bacillus inaquosorum]|uniref:hypothetical protein n=1 Tax=Bacillus inaquosorum TaxID=483913 RepID=UPI00227E4F2F|nr:hypothetical protein [Bacillus inaquosorum]MCY8147731.1 hypothetical protein [Bacillus inaquosorum]MEC0575320.1 hypothetical protein [Bacillus inaquosorum]
MSKEVNVRSVDGKEHKLIVRPTYFSVVQAKKTYVESDGDTEDDTVLIQIFEEESSDNSIIKLDVDSAEQIGLALLNLCNEIKY